MAGLLDRAARRFFLFSLPWLSGSGAVKEPSEQQTHKHGVRCCGARLRGGHS